MGAPVTAQLLMNPSELWLWRCVHRRTRTACTCLALREWHGALCCLSHLACWTLHDKAGLRRRIVRCAPHGASAARAAHEPPSSEPGNAQAGPPHPRSRASWIIASGMSRARAEWRIMQGAWWLQHARPEYLWHVAYRTVPPAMPSRLVTPATPYTAAALQQLRRAARGRTRRARRPKVGRCRGPRTLADGRWSRRKVVGRGTNKTTSGPNSHPDSADSMSKLLDAVEKKEWEKMMVRRLLEVVWYLQRI